MITYFLIGLAFGFLMEYLWNYNNKFNENIDSPSWNIWESIILVLVWPIYLIYFIYSLLKNLNK